MGERRRFKVTAGLALSVSLALVAACTSGNGKPAPTSSNSGVTSSAVASTSDPSTPVPTTKATPTPVKTTPTPARPRVPADVPRTGKNLLTKNEKPPVMPIAATAHTAAGAKSFAAFFVRTIDWGFATTSGAYMHHYYSATCEECKQINLNLENGRRKGYVHLGDRFTLTSAVDVSRMVTARSGSVATIDVNFDATADEVVDRNHKFVSGHPGERGLRFRLWLRTLNGTWTVTSADLFVP